MEKREQWGRQIEFILTQLGYAVGLGNIWRFPYLCIRNGGGAFLIPYFFFLCVAGIPLYYMELYLGQFSSLSPIKVWKICPFFSGLGWAMIIVSYVLTLYYNTIISWTIYYLGSSFTLGDVPWSSCGNDWNTLNCFDNKNSNVTRSNASVYSNTSFLNTTLVKENLTTPAEEFWERKVLAMSSGIEDIGVIRWQMVLCLFAAWFIVFCCLAKGIKTLGKVIYVTAILPYVLLFILLVRGVTLPGAIDGIMYYILPKWDRLLHFNIWVDACLQIFYTLGPAYGGLITFASFSKFENNILRDSISIPLICCCTSFISGFVTFSVVGYLALSTGLPVDKVIKAGPGLAYVAYPSALAMLPIAPIWSVIFFLTLLTVGIDTQFGCLETSIAGMIDLFPRTRPYKPLVTGIICAVSFVSGLIFTTNAGIYFFQIYDWYCAVFSLLVIAILECIIVAWIYGVNQASSDIKMMLGNSLNWFFKITWCVITPLLMISCLVYSLSTLVPPYLGSYTYPSWAITFGWCLASLSVIPIPVCMVISYVKAYRHERNLLKALFLAVYPSKSWGPADKELKERYRYYGNMKFLSTKLEKDPTVINLANHYA